MTDDWSITTGDGGVALYLPSDFAAELDAHTGDGTIRNDLKISAAKRTASTATPAPHAARQARRRRQDAASIRTGDGSIRLKRANSQTHATPTLNSQDTELLAELVEFVYVGRVRYRRGVCR